MGGRIAEDVFIGSITTGASNDIEKATEIARSMVCEYGMSDLGPLAYGKKEEQIFLGREISQHRDYSEDTAIKIDQEVQKIITEQYHRAEAIIKENRDAMIRLAEALLEFETLDTVQIRRVVAGLPLDSDNSATVGRGRIGNGRGNVEESVQEADSSADHRKQSGDGLEEQPNRFRIWDEAGSSSLFFVMDRDKMPIEWKTSRRTLTLNRPLVMGILNVTPDSFSDGGRFASVDAALRQAEEMVTEGADIIDIGGESTRPGSKRVPIEIEIERTAPVIKAICSRFPIPISIDTTHTETAAAALDAGAEIINDISGLRFEEGLAGVASETGCGLILMHSRGSFETMHSQEPVPNIMAESAADFRRAISLARRYGVSAGSNRIWI